MDNPTPGTEEQHPRRRRLRAVRIAIATTAIGLAAAAVGAAAWYFGVFGG